jgi:hypothetical protein
MRRLSWLFVLFLPGIFLPASAQQSLEERLNSDRVGYVELGTYVAGDDVEFSLYPAGSNYLLRLGDNPEIFVLYQDRTSLGGRVLKYDTGETALRVAGWGGVTLYTHSAPQGLPAERTGDTAPLQLVPVSIGDLQSAATDEGQHLFYTRRLNLIFTANWNALARDANARIFALDTLENAARGVEQFVVSPRGQGALQHRLKAVSLMISGRPSVTLNSKTLVVGFDPARGYIGRASSRVIERDLAKILLAKDNAGLQLVGAQVPQP